MSSLVRILLAIFFPPIAVLVTTGFGLQFLLNILLWILGWLPGGFQVGFVHRFK